MKAVHWPGNIQLWLGALIITLVALVAIWGPGWAPQDPLQTNAIVKIDGDWVAAPFPPFKYARFPLGTDQNGRDILSQTLWAVRPTMIMVLIVTVVRVSLGLLIGLAAGWLTGPVGRLLNSLISAALSLPVLIVALAVIAAVGIDLGVAAFILGLAVTGWAETARLVGEQTRRIRFMPYIEAARALGQSSFGLLFHHVWRQITPLIWMLFAFVASDTLVNSAALGFLGYYIGGEVWTAITDTSSVRSSGMPELGQMVSTLVGDIFTGPWKMAAAVMLIFLTILGFNLLGEGLRLRIGQHRRSASPLDLLRERLALWMDQYIWHSIQELIRLAPRWVAAWGILLLIEFGLLGWVWLRSAPSGAILPKLGVPGGNLWASQLHDPYGTLQSSKAGPSANPQVLWSMHSDGWFTGGPVIAASGVLYIPTQSGSLVAYRPDGLLAWRTNLEALPVGSAALSEEGRIYVADMLGGLSAISPLGRVLWRFQPEGDFAATSGPVVDRQGNIYYLRGGLVQAVTPQGRSLWTSQARIYRTTLPPAMSPDGQLIFVLEAVLRQDSGQKLSFTRLADAGQYFTGADGRLYARSTHLLAEWQESAADAEIVQRIEWDYQLYGLISPPQRAGVTAGGIAWLMYYSDFEDGHFIWITRDGKVSGDVRFPQRRTNIIGLDGNSLAYICGTNEYTAQAECLALHPGQDDPLWTLALPMGSVVSGGALADGVLYVATAEYLFAIGAK